MTTDGLRTEVRRWETWRDTGSHEERMLRELAAHGNHVAQASLTKIRDGFTFVCDSMLLDIRPELARRLAPRPPVDPNAPVLSPDEQVAAALAAYPLRWKRTGVYYLTDCVWHPDQKRHLRLYPDSAFVHCFHCGAHHPLSDLLDFWASST